MKFATVSALVSLATLLQSVLADSESFGVLSSHSASNIHLLPFYDSGNGLFLGAVSTSNDVLGFTITDAGKLKFSNGKYAVVDSNGEMSEGDESNAATGWAIEKGIVTLNGSKLFYGVPTTDSAYPSNYKVYVKDVPNSNYFYMVGTTGDNNQQYTFIPPSSSPSSSVVQTTESTSSTAETIAATSSTEQSSTSISSLVTIAEQSENGAANLHLGATFGLAGIAALLL